MRKEEEAERGSEEVKLGKRRTEGNGGSCKRTTNVWSWEIGMSYVRIEQQNDGRS